MATSVTLNGTSYDVPALNEDEWGAEVSNYLIALGTGVLQKAGGSFTLTAELDFGATYGIKSAYFTSRGTAASAGIVRLANTEVISWRDAANSADIDLTTSASDRLTYGGVTVPTISSTDTITNKTMTSAGNTLTIDADVSTVSNIKNAEIKAGAAIDASKIHDASVSNTEFGYLNGVTSAIQTQIDSKTGIADAETITGVYTFDEAIGTKHVSTPSNPASGYMKVYTKSDNKLYTLNSSGTETDVASGAGTASASTQGLTTSYHPTIQSSVHNPGDANYTVLDGDGYRHIVMGTTLTANRTVTLPTAADNDGREITVTKGDSSSFAVLFDGEGSENIDGATDKRLITQYDSATLVCDGSKWYFVSFKMSPVRQFVGRNSTGGAHGSTDNKIAYLPTEIDAGGTGLFTVSSNSVNGTSISITKRCRIFISYTCAASGGGSNIGISKNTSTTTTAIQSITAADRVAYSTTPAANGTVQVCYSGIAEASDFFKPHTEGSSLSTTASRNTLWVECESIEIDQ